jgi:hypothetical protein
LALHPFNRVLILLHGDFTVYETSAIVSYVEDMFDSVALRPANIAMVDKHVVGVPGGLTHGDGRAASFTWAGAQL